MPRFIAVLLAGLLAFALGGSSCNGYSAPSEQHAAPPTQPRMSDDINIGYQGVAPPQTQAIPRR
ncbi:hypothetical protein [Pseudomonas sp. SCB32]|uniref:hypothetical protein n=1 Tax=Pseudomonas sp. SCB32 TaxID=2653853 RepID=UPI0012658747|nr:hypothetical protein [Pseudomonas sp. SCB32]